MKKKIMYDLMPILEAMWACQTACDWLRAKKFETFTEAYDALDNSDWLAWLLGSVTCGQGAAVQREYYKVEGAAYAADMYRDSTYRDILRDHYPAERVQKALIQIAKKKGWLKIKEQS